jgi:hypothetical protein
MRRTIMKNKKELKLEKRLALVRTTIRELRPNQLAEVNGGSVHEAAPEWPPGCSAIYTI